MSTLQQLAVRARTMQEAGTKLADKAIEGEVLSVEDRALIEQLAKSGDEQALRELEQLDDAEIAIFTDAFARNAYLRKQVALLDTSNLDTVIARLYALRATTMPSRGKMLPAIQLLAVYDRYSDARKHHRRPLPLTNATRKDKGQKNEHIDARIEQYLVPATTLDREVFEQFQRVLLQSADALIERLDNCERMSPRRAVWYAVHFLPGSLVLTPKWAERIFEAGPNGACTHRGNKQHFVRFDLSSHEVFFTPKDDRAVRLIDQLKALAES